MMESVFHKVVLALMGESSGNKGIVSVRMEEEQRRLSSLICAQATSEIKMSPTQVSWFCSYWPCNLPCSLFPHTVPHTPGAAALIYTPWSWIIIWVNFFIIKKVPFHFVWNETAQKNGLEYNHCSTGESEVTFSSVVNSKACFCRESLQPLTEDCVEWKSTTLHLE